MQNLAAIFLVLLFAPFAHARWAPPEDASATRVYARIAYDVKKNGTYSYTLDQLVRINSETARSSEGTAIIPYNRNSAKFTLLEAAVIQGEQKIPVGKEHIEDVAIASENQGFDPQNQVTIAFPQAEVGAKLLLKYRVDVNDVAFPGHFAAQQWFGAEQKLDEDIQLTIKSEIPLRVAVNDPNGALDVKETQRGGRTELFVRQKRPIFSSVIDEGEESFQPERIYTQIMVSSYKSYEELVTSVGADYEKVLAAPLPPEFEAIRAKAKETKSFVEAADVVTSMTADLIRYMGDWRPTRGSFIPRDLSVIASTRFGDCKDFSAVITAILRRLGYAANVAWIDRNELPSDLGLLPSPEFNHAIVRATADGKIYWLDGTNTASFAAFVPEDLFDRDALVIDASKPRLERVRLADPAESMTDIDTELVLDARGDGVASHRVHLTGLSAEPVISSTRVTSKDSYDNELVKWLSGSRFIKWSKVGAYDRSSRAVRSMTLPIDVGLRQAAIATTAGMAYYIASDELDMVLKLDPAKVVSDIFISTPRTYKERIALTHARLVGAPPPACRADTPWYTAKRRITPNADEVVIEQEVIYKKPRITNAELKSDAFTAIQLKTQACVKDFAVIFTLSGSGNVVH